MTEKYHLTNKNNEFSFLIKDQRFVLINFTDHRMIQLIKWFLLYDYQVRYILKTIADKAEIELKQPTMDEDIFQEWIETGLHHAVNIANEVLDKTITQESLNEMSDGDLLNEVLDINNYSKLIAFLNDLFDCIEAGIYIAFKNNVFPNREEYINRILKEKQFIDLIDNEYAEDVITSNLDSPEKRREQLHQILLSDISKIANMFGLDVEVKEYISPIEFTKMPTIGNA